MTDQKHLSGFLIGIFFMILLGVGAMYLADLSVFRKLAMSSLTLAIILGMVLGNFRLFHVSGTMETGIHFVQKRLLRAGVMLYGFRISFQEIIGVGLPGLVIDLLMITATFLVGAYLGVKLFKLDMETSILNASGSSICGAAAVIATEGVVQGGSKKTAVAVSTVVLFGTISMFLYPLLYHFAGLSPDQFGIYIGSTIHEVAQVVVAGSSISSEVAATAVIVKMTRVMLLAPFLLLLGWFLASRLKKTGNSGKNVAIAIPWFAVGFIFVSGFHSVITLPEALVNIINKFDTVLLAAAMAALGMGTTIQKMRGVGIRPFLHGLFLFLFLIIVGFGVNYTVSHLLHS